MVVSFGFSFLLTILLSSKLFDIIYNTHCECEYFISNTVDALHTSIERMNKSHIKFKKRSEKKTKTPRSLDYVEKKKRRNNPEMKRISSNFLICIC